LELVFLFLILISYQHPYKRGKLSHFVGRLAR
jgi:hypothetical protein